MPGARHHYRVVRDIWGPNRAEISLVREQMHHGLRARIHEKHPGGLVLFQRTFKPRSELDELERYARELEHIAGHGNAGTLG